jgi:hypothetical protein
MGLFRNFRSITVGARHCTNAGTIATDPEFSNVKRRDWVIRGKDGESHILNDDFFERAFASIVEQLSSRASRDMRDHGYPSESNTFSNKLGHITGAVCENTERKHARATRRNSPPVRLIREMCRHSRRSESFLRTLSAAHRSPKANHSI